ncbi:MAG: glycine cleavage system protein GcvH [Candidatus Margulisiibacteriota bacterium]|nr:MAG: glycine cleavage system protein GcvH [Candidatus Margulisiibacteriota bacterium]HAR64326.1 glycine cleavage system protein GcvH [Candidatus Margulisiibacteriota bacterium]HCT84288.1 glycine cleavage system protein GcvH [Candidatus Margulisiibacteriota bacterium]HCY37518.1 glycine cleavage system protein GcvH [Candidatus Margulisiibacteriota bacterium]
MMTPENLRYSKEHEWVQVKKDIAIIGITYYAQKELGELVYVELPEVGGQVEQMQECGVVESVKTVSNIYSPVTGEVIAINENAIDTPDIINDSPYENGWLMKVKIEDEGEIDDLMTAEEYDAYLEEKG